MAIDPGIALQPDNIVAQCESNIIYGLSQTINEHVTIEDVRFTKANSTITNYSTWPISRISRLK